MGIIFSMSLSGSVAILAILLIHFLLGKGNLLRWKLFWLRISMALFLFPVPLLKEQLAEFWAVDEEISPWFWLKEEDRFLVIEDRAVTISHSEWVQIWILGIALLVAAIFLIRNLLKYFRLKGCKEIFEKREKHSEWGREIEALSSKLKIKKKVVIYTDPYDRAALTAGVISPTVIVPERLAGDRRYVVLLHELFHIKMKDPFWKMLVSIVICMHWFNPFVFLLPRLYDELCEFRCDEMVLAHLGIEQKRIYAEEILKQSFRSNGSGVDEMAHFGWGKKLTEVRIRNIRDKRNGGKSTMRWKAAGIVLSLVVGIACYIPVQAYEKPTVLRVSGGSSGNEGLMVGSREFSFQESVLEEIIPVIYEKQFTDENGRVYNAENQEKRAGSHPSKISGEYQVHQRNDDGSCDIFIYSAQKCTNCGKIFWGDLISSTYYKRCPHG